jgi:hypothetical protein
MKKIAIQKKSPSKLPMKKITNEEAVRMSIVNTQAVFWPKKALEELAKKQLPNIPLGTQIDDKTWKNMCSVSLAYGVKSGMALIKNTPKEYESLAIQMKMDIEKELNCDKIYEKALVDQIVNAYIKSLRYSLMLSVSQDFEFHGNARNGYFFFLSKESDRAFRQFTSGLEMLRSLKQPKMNLKLSIKSNNAFVAENQQFNNNQNNKDANQ